MTPDMETISAAVLLAGRAPSVHNTQPWRWVLSGSTLQLFRDNTRAIPQTDQHGRQALISCGAALDHLRVAMSAHGWRTRIREFPNPNQASHLASLTFSPSPFITPAQRERAAAIVARHTDRQPFGAPPDWEFFEKVLRALLNDSGVTLDVLSDGARPALARASALANALRRYDSGYHAELHWWAANPAWAEAIPASALPTPDEAGHVPIGRVFPQPARAGVAIGDDAARIMVLSTDSDSAADALSAGMALSTVLLEATMAGLVTCPLTHLTENSQSRDTVRELASADRPQVLIRVGTSTSAEPESAPRLPLTEILTIAQGKN